MVEINFLSFFGAALTIFQSSKVSKLRIDHLDAVIPTKTQAEKEDEKWVVVFQYINIF